jgi:maltose 6'-phosphate phosphatase
MGSRIRVNRTARIVKLVVLSQLLTACTSSSESQQKSETLAILSLNLHTYQELRDEDADESKLTEKMAQQRIDAYGPVFDRIAAGIDQLDPDIVCLQEVGEWSGGVHGHADAVVFGATDSNMVHQILSRLSDERYYYTMDWSHYGWDVWLEGSAILSKYPLTLAGSRFISDPDNGAHQSWKSRNVPMASVDVPGLGSVGVFSIHAGWWDDAEEPAKEQYRRLLDWVAETAAQNETTILCGDFNAPAGGPAYRYLIGDTEFSDQYLLANPEGMHDATIGAGADGWQESDSGERIDYILVNADSPLTVSHARRVFTQTEFGRVSDHVGVYAEFGVPHPEN